MRISDWSSDVCSSDLLEHRLALFGVGDFNQDAERQCVVNHRLTNVENVHTTLGQNAGNGRSQTRTVTASDVYQDDFAQGAPPQVEKNRILPTFSDHRAPSVLCRSWGCRYTARQFHGQRDELSEPAHASQNRQFLSADLPCTAPPSRADCITHCQP